jgi:hypothetical protein
MTATWQPFRSYQRQLRADTGRWLGPGHAVAQAAEQARRAALAQIAALEAGQPRALREAALGLPEGLERLKAIDAQIVGLRAQLNTSQ